MSIERIGCGFAAAIFSFLWCCEWRVFGFVFLGFFGWWMFMFFFFFLRFAFCDWSGVWEGQPLNNVYLDGT